MATVRKTLAETKTAPFRFSQEQKDRLDAMTDEQIETAASEDPDAQPLTDAQLNRAVLGRMVRRIRERSGLSQDKFGERFGIPPATLRDWEQGRREPDATARTLLRVIDADPDAVARAVAG